MPESASLPIPAANARKILFLALAFFFTFGFSNVSYFLPVYYAQIGLAPANAAGWLVSAFYIASVASRPFLGSAVSLLGFKRAFYAAGVLGVCSSIGVAASGTYFIPALISRCVLGVASSLFQIGLATYQGIAFRPQERGRAFSLIMAGGLAPMMTLVPIAELFLRNNWNTLFIVFPGLICLGAALITPLIPGLDETEPAPKRPAAAKGSYLGGFIACFRIRQLRMAFLAVFLFSVTDASAAFMGAMTAHYGLMASFFLSSNAVIGVIVRLFCARLLDRYPRGAICIFSTSVTASALFLASVSPAGGSLIALGMLYGVGMGLGFPAHLALISDVAPKRLQPQAVSLCWFLIGVAFAFVPLLAAVLTGMTNPVISFRAIVLPVLILTAWSYRLRRRGKSELRK